MSYHGEIERDTKDLLKCMGSHLRVTVACEWSMSCGFKEVCSWGFL